MKNKYIGGAITLAGASLIAKFLGAIYRIPLTNILGAEGIGVYQLSFPIYSLLLVFASGGFPLALSKIIAENRAEKNYVKVNSYFKKTFLITSLLGIFFALLLLVGADAFANLQGNSMVTQSYSALSLATVFACALCAFRGLFQGYQNMLPSSFSMVIEQLVKLVVGIALAKYYLPYGISYAVFGAVLGIAIGEIVAFIYLFIEYLFKKANYNLNCNIKTSTNKLLPLAVPITLGAIISPLSSAFDSLFVVKLMQTYFSQANATSLFGLQTGMINPLINFPIIFITAICVSLMPSISYAIKKKDREQEQVLVEQTLKFSFVLMLACAVGYSILAFEILDLLYPNIIKTEFIPVAKLLFVLSSITMFFTALAQTITTILQAKDKPYLAVKNLAISMSVKIVLTIVFVLIPSLNIVGLALANAVSLLLYFALNFASLKKVCKYRFRKYDIFASSLSATVMLAVVLFAKNLLFGYDKILVLGVCLMLGVMTYFALIFALKVVKVSQIVNIFSKSKG